MKKTSTKLISIILSISAVCLAAAIITITIIQINTRNEIAVKRSNADSPTVATSDTPYCQGTDTNFEDLTKEEIMGYIKNLAAAGRTTPTCFTDESVVPDFSRGEYSLNMIASHSDVSEIRAAAENYYSAYYRTPYFDLNEEIPDFSGDAIKVKKINKYYSVAYLSSDALEECRFACSRLVSANNTYYEEAKSNSSSVITIDEAYGAEVGYFTKPTLDAFANIAPIVFLVRDLDGFPYDATITDDKNKYYLTVGTVSFDYDYEDDSSYTFALYYRVLSVDKKTGKVSLDARDYDDDGQIATVKNIPITYEELVELENYYYADYKSS